MCDTCGGHQHHDRHQSAETATSEGIRIAITGKGGVGKTTLAGVLSRVFADEGFRVLALDADPDSNFASSLGMPQEKIARIAPLSKMKDLARERTGASEGFGTHFKLNPRVSDLRDEFSISHAGVDLLLMGTVEQGGTGCVCPEHTLVRRLMSHLLLDRNDVVIMDMEAGIEHLGRGTAESVDALLVVVEPGQRSLQTAAQVSRLAADIGITKIFYVGSKVGGDGDRQYLEEALAGSRLLGCVSTSELIRKADKEGVSVYDFGGGTVAEVVAIKDNLLKELEKIDH